VKIRFISIAALVVLLSLGIVSYLGYVKNHRQLADIGPVDEAGDVPLSPPIERDLDAIKQRGALMVLAPYNSTTYFLLRGEPMGYEYELLQAFSREHGLKLVMEVVKNQKTLYQMLNRGDGDIVAARIIPKLEDEAKVSFTHTLYRTAPALVHQKAPLDQANLPEPVKTAIRSEPANINRTR
jgi:membrane-bound lytic murein transglycosylase MltF